MGLMPRKRDESLTAYAVRLYRDPPDGEGLTTRAVAAELDVDEKTVRGWLRDAGVTRPRGRRPRIDPDSVRKARKGRKQP
jgi:transposase